MRARLAGPVAGVLLLAGCAQVPIGGHPPRAGQSAQAQAQAQAQTAAPATIVTAEPLRKVTVHIDAAIEHQVIEGFGATHTEHFDLATRADLMGDLRPRVIDAAYGQIGITMGHLDVGPYENFDPLRYTTANDDDDPYTFNWPAFNFVRSDGQKSGVVDPARRHGFDNFTIHSGTNVRWSDPWMAALRQSNYRRYLDEMAENVVAPLVYFRDRFGITTRWHHLFNEPLTGNGELAGAGVQEIVDLVKAVGERFRREGFGALRFVVASEETEEASLAAARAVLADPDARRLVGAISYHTYPYGSIYSDVNRILATSGAGQPDAGRIKVRNDIRDLARQHGVQVWMTEVSHGRAGPLDSMRGRAIHIHDELRHAGASSYWAMFQAWDGLATRGTCDEDCLVHFNRARGTVSISGTGYAIGHYARWVRRGAVRVEARSDDPLVLVSAFRDAASKKLVAVVINNHPHSIAIGLHAPGMAGSDGVRGEQSPSRGYWLSLDVSAAADERLGAIAPAHSVSTLSVPLR